MPEVRVKCPYCRREFIVHLGLTERTIEEEEKKEEVKPATASIPTPPKVELKPKLPGKE